MNKAIRTALLFAFGMQAATTAQASSLDEHFTKIKASGGLAALCINNPTIDECRIAIGDWKPQEIERVRSQSIQCTDACPLDTYGFVKSSDGSRTAPQVSTKDYDGASPSRGVEFRLFPVAIEILKYEGCSGCPLIKTSPRHAWARTNEGNIKLPLIGYGVFYLPRAFRRLSLASRTAGTEVEIIVDYGKSKEIRRISKTATKEYATMLMDLNYHLLP